jgi:DUF4097 and DUF4098 domain-containing protein YvlB
MIRSLSPAVAFVLAAANLPALVAQDSQIAREGRYWVRTVTGSAPVAQARIEVRTNGDVTILGGTQNGYSYSAKLRVRASNERQARERLAAMRLSATVRGDQLVLSAPATSGNSELRLNIPRTVKEVAVTTAGGGVDVSELAGTLRCETGGGGVRCDRIGGNVVVATGGGGISLGTIDGMVQCVTAGGGISANIIRGDAVFETGGGDIVVREVTGLVRASTAGGGIKIDRAGSAVIASTAGGPIQVERAAGMVTAKSSAGPIQVNSARSVQCESAAGGIRLHNVSGSLHATTAVGSIVAALLANQPFGESSLITGSGDITVFIPSNLGVTIRAENEAANNLRRIVSDFPGLAVRLVGNSVVAEGPVNGGGATLQIKGTGGTIYIKKQ